MRRREKFVIISILLSLGLALIQLIDLDYRYLAVAALGGLSYLLSLWALKDDLQPVEALTIVPFPSLYAVSVALFYFLLPENIVSRVSILILFGVGMYALFLVSNIYSVSKGRTIQLVHAAHAISLLFTLLISLLLGNSIFSLRLPFYLNSGLIFVTYLPLILMSLWSIRIEQKLGREVLTLSLLLTLILAELAALLSLIPISIWNVALLLMAVLYIGLGILHNHLRGILFQKAMVEYSLVAGLVAVIFFLIFPLK